MKRSYIWIPSLFTLLYLLSLGIKISESGFLDIFKTPETFASFGVFLTLFFQTWSISQTEQNSENQHLENRKERFINLLMLQIDFFEKRRNRLPEKNAFSTIYTSFEVKKSTDGKFCYEDTNHEENPEYRSEIPKDIWDFESDSVELFSKITHTELLNTAEKNAFKRLAWGMCSVEEKKFYLCRAWEYKRSHKHSACPPYRDMLSVFSQSDIWSLFDPGERSVETAKQHEDARNSVESFKQELEACYGVPIATARENK